MSEELIDLHGKNGYIINVLGEKNKIGCSVQYPSNYLVETPVVNIQYKYILSKFGINIYCYKGDELIKQIEYECPDAAKRVLIFQDLLLKCLALRISAKLIKTKDENNKDVLINDFFTILKPPKQLKNEKILRNYMINTLNNIDEPLENLDNELEQSVIKLLNEGGF